jgi:hypothetical protein
VEKLRIELNVEREKRKQLLAEQEELNDDIVEYEKMRTLRKVASKEELSQIITRLTQRNEKNNSEKINYLKQKLMNNRDKPTLTDNTERIWEQRKLKKELSSNVLDRFDQYMWNRQKSREQLINTIREKETPFKPNISKQSIQILSKSNNAKTNRLERSLSCKCFQKKNYDNQSRTFGDRNNSTTTLQPNTVEHTKQQSTLFPYRFC